MDLDELMAMLDGVEFEGRDDFISGVNNLSAGATARITELETDLARANADLQEAQANNYKLIMAQTAEKKPEEEETSEVTEEDKDVTKLIKD